MLAGMLLAQPVEGIHCWIATGFFAYGPASGIPEVHRGAASICVNVGQPSSLHYQQPQGSELCSSNQWKDQKKKKEFSIKATVNTAPSDVPVGGNAGTAAAAILPAERLDLALQDGGSGLQGGPHDRSM
jgi:hypothetical protein